MGTKRSKEQLENNFWSRVNKTDSCWLWTGATYLNGYGTCHYNGKQTSTHRVSWMRAFGTIPDGQLVLHKCDMRLCVNPAHLFLGTQKDNIRDCIQKNRFIKGAEHVNSKLTMGDVRLIRESIEPQHILAKRFGVVQQTISRIKRGERYAA